MPIDDEIGRCHGLTSQLVSFPKTHPFYKFKHRIISTLDDFFPSEHDYDDVLFENQPNPYMQEDG